MPNPFDIAEGKASSNPFDQAEKDRTDFSNIKINPYDAYYQEHGRSGGIGPGGIPMGSEQFGSGDPIAALKLGYQIPGKALNYAGEVARSIPADVAAGFAGDPEHSGNVPAAIMGDNLPIDTALDEAAQESAYQGGNGWESTLGHVSQDAAASAPLLLAGGGPAVARALAAGFTAKMIADAPEVAREYGDELGKNKEDQDPAKLARLRASAIGIVGGTLLGAHGAKGYGRDVHLTPGDYLRTFERDVNEKPINFNDAEAPPIRQLGIQYNPNVLNDPVARPAVEQAFSERTPGHIALPGEMPAADRLRQIAEIPGIEAEMMKPGRTLRGVHEPGETGINPTFEGLTVVPPVLRSGSDLLLERRDPDLAPVPDVPPTVREGVTGPEAPSYRRPQPAPTLREAELRQQRANVEAGLEGRATEYVGSEELPYQHEGQYPTEGGPEGTFSNLQRERIQAGQTGVRSNVRNNPPMEGPNAKGIRSDTGQPPKPGEGGEGGEANRGGDVQQTPPGTPPGELGGQGNAPTTKVAPEVETFSKQLDAGPDQRVGNNESHKAGLGAESIGDLEALAKMAEQQRQKTMDFLKSIEGLPMEERFKKMAENPDRSQLAREAIEVATNTGGWIEDEGMAPAKLGERPLDWEKNPEVKQWLQDNANRIWTSKASLEANQELLGKQPVAEAAGAPAAGVTPPSPTDSLITKLEGMKLNRGIKGEVGSTNIPEFIKSYGAALWDTALDIAIQGIKAGKAINEAVDSAITHLKRNAKNVDEAKVREYMAGILEKEKPGTGGTGTPGGVARPELETGAERTRKLSERGSESPSVPEPVQTELKESDRSKYNQQSMEQVQETVRKMSDAELADIGENDPVFTAAKLEQAQRLFDAGKNDAGYEVFQNLSEKLTRLGQVINQAKLLQSLKPENVVKVLNAELKKRGRDPLTDEQAGDLVNLSRDRIETGRALDKATDQWVKDPTDANAKLAEAALNEANAAALAEQQFTHRFQNRSMAGLLKSILQGNLLTPISQVANLVGNMSFAPFRAGSRAIGAGIDAIDATLRNRPRELAVRPGVGSVEVVKGLIRGMKQIPDIMMKGSGDVIKGESRTGLHPLEAWAKMFAKDPNMPTVGGKVPFSDRVKLAIEGTLGVPAEMMLRGLGAGDMPFRSAARARLIAEAAKLKGVPDSRMAMAQKFPELFFDNKTLARIESETARDLFQRESETLQHVTSLLGKKGSFFDLLVSFVAPYKLTPWNIIGEILSYNPIIAAGKTALEAKRGNARAAEMSAGKMVVGGMLTAAGWWLYKKGLLAPSMDQENEAQKARILAGEVLPPNHVNLSGLKRAIAGGDASYKPGDETADVFRAGGLAGSMLYMAANIGRDLEKKPDTASIPGSLLRDSVIEQARFGVNQSFLKGVAGVLQSVTSGDTDNFIQAFENSVLSIPIPNTLSTISKARRDFKPDLKTDKLNEEFTNIVKNRLGFTGLDKDFPLKRGLWGEPLRETPEGRNSILYHFFDITKNKQVTDDPVPLELYRLWRSTGNTSVIPSIPSRTMTVGKNTYAIDSDQYSHLVEMVGKNRRMIADKLVVNPNWAKLPDESKIQILGQAYDFGLSAGKLQFVKQFGTELEKRGAKAGFSPK